MLVGVRLATGTRSNDLDDEIHVVILLEKVEGEEGALVLSRVSEVGQLVVDCVVAPDPGRDEVDFVIGEHVSMVNAGPGSNARGLAHPRGKLHEGPLEPFHESANGTVVGPVLAHGVDGNVVLDDAAIFIENGVGTFVSSAAAPGPALSLEFHRHVTHLPDSVGLVPRRSESVAPGDLVSVNRGLDDVDKAVDRNLGDGRKGRRNVVRPPRRRVVVDVRFEAKGDPQAVVVPNRRRDLRRVARLDAVDFGEAL